MGFLLGYAVGQQENDDNGTFGDFVICCFQVLWYGLLLVLWLVFVAPVRLILWLRRRKRRAPRHRYEPEGLEFFEPDPEKKDVWRYGY
jgi:hypothetical protein